MEEQIQNCLTSVWEMTTEGEELIVQKLAKLSFEEPLKSEQIIFLCSRLISSDMDLFKYLDANCGMMDRKLIAFRRKVIEFLKEFIVFYSTYCVDYLEYIRKMCIALYRAEQSLVLKEKVLMLTAKTIDIFSKELIENIYQPKDYIEVLLDEIKLNKLSCSIKGCIWYIVGILIGKFSILLSDYKIEVHDVIFNDFKVLVTQKKFEFKSATGILKSYMYLLEDPHLKSHQINELYIYLKSLINPLPDANTIKINKLALEVLGTHGKMFSVQLKNDSLNLFDAVFDLCNHKNYELKMAANEAIEKVSMHISDCLLEDSIGHKDIFNYLIMKIKNVLERKDSSLLINTAISLIGIFSNAIVRFMGEAILSKYLEELIVLCDKEIITTLGQEAYREAKHLTDADSFKPSKSIKYILSIQKQYISLLNSYSNIIANLSSLSELVVKHFYNVLIVGFSVHSRFFEKYKERFSESIAVIIVNMVRHQNYFWSFLRKVVKNGFIESIKMTQNMIFKENIEEISIANAIKFWVLLFTRDKALTEFTVTKLFDQLFTEVNGLVDSLNISYVEKTNESNDVYYEANSVDDLEIFIRTCKFLNGFINCISDQRQYGQLQNLFNKWILILLKHFSRLANEYPRIAICYSVLSSLMKISEAMSFFGRNNRNSFDSFISEFKAFNLSVVKKVEIFQDELLLNAIEFLLSIPPELMREIYQSDVKTLKYLFIKSFEIGFNDLRYAKLALKALKKFFEGKAGLPSSVSLASNTFISNKLSQPASSAEDLRNKEMILNEILPIFGQYLSEYEKIKESLDSSEIEKVERYSKIQNKIFTLLGSIGGEAHRIIPSTEVHKNNLLSIMNTKKISYFFPLYNKKYSVFFDNLLIKISDMAINSVVKEKKFAACELLHSLILYIIGKATEEMDNTLIFLMEKILFLACDLEKGISVIYETLLFQIIHWMSKKGSVKENKDIISMLDIIIDCSSSRKNLKLRELSSDCLREYIKWFIKQHTDHTIKEKSSTVKYLIRKVESNSLHPDPFKRLGSSLCFEKILPVIASNDFLVDKFLLEIVFYLVSIIKICHNSTELNEFVFQHCFNSLELLFKGIKSKSGLLSKHNQKRNVFKDLKELFEFFHSIVICNEIECSFAAQSMFLKLFDLIGRELLKCESLVHYFNKNDQWPVLQEEVTVANYQFIHFLISNSIVSLPDLSFKYPLYAIDNLIQSLLFIIKDIKNSEVIDKKIGLISLISIFKLNKEASAPALFDSLIKKEKSDLVESLFDVVQGLTNKDIKYFVLSRYENILFVFIDSIKELVELLFSRREGSLSERIERYLTDKCLVFKDYSNEAELNDSCSKNEKCIEFLFWLLANIYPQLRTGVSPIIERLKSNFLLLIEHPQPKSQLLIKFHFNFLFTQDFPFITSLLSKSQFYFDYLADYFFNNILDAPENSGHDKQWAQFLADCCLNSSQLVIILILFERAALSKKTALTKRISDVFLRTIRKMDSQDAIVNQIKIATIILINSIDNPSNVMAVDDVAMTLIDMYIAQKPINVIKEILNLLGLIVKLGNKKHKEAIKMKYITIQSRYFPVNTKCLTANTKEWTDFQLIFSCLLNTFKTVETFEFLEILFPILREEKTEYSYQVKQALKNYLANIVKTNNINEIQKTIDVFLNKASDSNLRDNIRFTIMKVIGFKFLKCCSCESAAQLLINNFKRLEEMLKVNEALLLTNEEKFTLILEKTTIYRFIQLALQKIPTEQFKSEVHKEIYGVNTQGNEITKFLIAELHNSKRKPINNWELICKQLKFSEYNSRASNQADTELYTKTKENEFYCAAYTCLCVLIKLTQVKEDIFSKFLFTTFRDKKEQLFDLLISSHFTYNFPIETNFHTKVIQHRADEGKEDKLKPSSSKKLLIDEIITDSFFHDAYGASMKESLAFTQNQFSLDFISKFNSKVVPQKASIEALIKSIPLVIEKDYVNKHPVMNDFLIVLDHMNALFPPVDQKLPGHLQLLLNEMKRSDLSVNLKIFFIKVIVNKREIFNPYMNHFFHFLMKFSIEKNQCGKGFNYFLRDIATCLLSSDKLVLERSKENIELVSSYVNTLIKLCGDTKNIIFRTNLKIVNDLMEKFSKVLFLHKKTLVDMIKFDEKKEASHIWKITAVQILASALEYDISIGDDLIYSYSNDLKRLFMKSLEKHEEIVALLIKLCESHRTPVQSASIEVLARLLAVYYKEEKFDSKIYMTTYDFLALQALGKNDKQTVNAIFRTSMHFPHFAERKELFNKSLQLIKNANQKGRNLILNSLISFITEIVARLTEGRSKNEVNDRSYVDDCYYNLYQFTEVIFVDPNDELVINCVGLLTPMIKMKERKYSEGILRIVKRIQREIRRKDEATRTAFYSFLFELFNQSYDEALEKEVLNYIVVNFDCEQSKELLKMISQFINKSSKIPPHPAERLTYLMMTLSKETIEAEGKFIQFLIKMTMILIYTSGDFELKINEKGLEDCVYRDLNINTSGYYLNRSQPIAPSIAIRNSMSEAYETLLSVNQFEMTQANMIKASLNPNAMDVDKDNSSNQPLPSVSLSQRDLTLSQYSSLVNTTANYPSMKTENKLVNFGLTHGEAFKMPDPVRPRKGKGGYSSFLSENEMTYTPIENTVGNNIRFVPEGANRRVKKQKELSEEILVQKWLYRENEIRKNQVKLMRQYRDGDLPDIQIKNKDILEPLLAVCNYNSDISSELFLELMGSIYKESMEDSKSNRLLEQNVEMILKEHKLANYLVVSCLHRLVLSFMKENGDYSPQLALIKHSGLYSKNYHSSILIFEEVISQKKSLIEEDVQMTDINLLKKKKKIEVDPSSVRSSKCDIMLTEANKHAWTNLLQFYSKMKIEDYEIGLMQNFSFASGLFLKDSSDFLSVLSSWMTKPKTIMNRNINKTNLLKAVFNITGSTINPAIDALRVKYSSSLFKDEALMEVIEDYAISSCSDLGEWDDLSSYLEKKTLLQGATAYKENPDKVTALLKSWVYTSSQELQGLMDFINEEISAHNNSIYKTFTENSFAYYLSLYYINEKNFDRAFLYYQKAKSHLFKTWLNLGTFCYDLKHEVVQSIQKLYEVGEFLSFIRGTSASNPNLSFGQEMLLSEEGNKNVVSLFDSWLNRWPNHLYDDSSAFHEVFSARKLINNTMKQKIANYEQIISLNPLLDTFIPRSLIEIAKNLYKKNYLDLAEVNIKSALVIRKENSFTNSYIVYPIMKNKFKIYQIETSTSAISYQEIESNYQKFLQILNNQMKTLAINSETREKLLILQVKILLNLTELSKRSESQSNFLAYYKKAKDNFDEEESKMKKSIEGEFSGLYLKLLRPMIKFCDGVIRNETYKSENETFYNVICQQYMECGLKALIMNDCKMSNIIPKIFDLLFKNQALLGRIFTNYSKNINVDYYIKWKNQLIAYINTPIADLIQPIIENILSKDSQSLFYTFTTVEMYHEIFFQNPHKKTKLFFYLKDFYSKYVALNGFVEALDGLTHPEHRLTFWLKQMASVLENFIEKGDMGSTVNGLQNILEVMRYDVFNTNKKFINKKIGSYNAKFANDCLNAVNSILTIENFKKLINKQQTVSADLIKDFGKMIEPINGVISKNTGSQYNEGIERLATFSEWLAQYECNDFSRPEAYITLPTALPGSKVIISSFDQHIVILPSIRRPKRLVVYGNDEKSYIYLVKGCEDIRLDQRIEEVFKVCNDILFKDSNCTKKKIKLNTFDVIPITQKLGLIEWVSNTQPLLGVIKYSMENIFNNKNWQLPTSAPQIARAKWYSQFNSDGRAPSIQLQHVVALHSKARAVIVNGLQAHENLLPKTVLKRALEHYLLTPEEVLISRIQFMRNYSALSIACYILGIGDRHLDNFLINIYTSEIVAIDFGVAFGQGILQAIPELVPFRLTCQIRNVIYPFGINGVIRQTMIDCLSAFKLSKDYILDYCEVFVKEPLLDWIKRSKSGLSDFVGSHSSDMNLNWLPMKKLAIIENKLNGMNPINIMLDEFLESTIYQKPMTKEIINEVLYGSDPDSTRIRNKRNMHLNVETQVDALNEQALDQNLLGRMWLGWSPFL